MPIRWLPSAAIRLHRGAVRAQQIVRGDRRLEAVAMARRQRAVQVAAVGDHPGLVDGRPQLDPVVEPAEHDGGVVGEPVGDIRIEPAAEIVERRRQIPVIRA